MTTNTLYVIKGTDESRSDASAAKADDSELFLDLDASSAYWIEGHIMFNTWDNYGARIQYNWNYSGTLYNPDVHIVVKGMPAYWTYLFQNVNPTNVNFHTSQSGMENAGFSITTSTSANSALRGTSAISGRITTTTSGRFSFKWKHYDTGAPAGHGSTVYAGSWLYATPLDICPI